MSAPEPGGHWFLPVARYLGPAYLRNAFTMGTEQEVAFLVDALGLEPGRRVLDAGCGPGRHALALARLGIEVLGIDLSPEFVELAREAAAAADLPATFQVLDVRDVGFTDEFDAVICLCQGGFGLLGGREDAAVVGGLARAVRPGGRVALSAFSAYFALRFLEESEDFDVVTGVLHERATVRGPRGDERDFDLWTTCLTARELALIAEASGLTDVEVHGVTPGDHAARPPGLDRPELLLLARRVG